MTNKNEKALSIKALGQKKDERKSRYCPLCRQVCNLGIVQYLCCTKQKVIFRQLFHNFYYIHLGKKCEGPQWLQRWVRPWAPRVTDNRWSITGIEVLTKWNGWDHLSGNQKAFVHGGCQRTSRTWRTHLPWNCTGLKAKCIHVSLMPALWCRMEDGWTWLCSKSGGLLYNKEPWCCNNNTLFSWSQMTAEGNRKNESDHAN